MFLLHLIHFSSGNLNFLRQSAKRRLKRGTARERRQDWSIPLSAWPCGSRVYHVGEQSSACPDSTAGRHLCVSKAKFKQIHPFLVNFSVLSSHGDVAFGQRLQRIIIHSPDIPLFIPPPLCFLSPPPFIPL